MKRIVDSDFFWRPPSPVAPGNFLIASPALHGSPLEKAVVFVLQNNSAGTFGVVLNRPADSRLTTSWREATGLNFATSTVVNGGPIGGPVLALHPEKSLGEVEICEGLSLSIDSEAIKLLAGQNEFPYRIVLGIVGWKPGQLDLEMGEGLWYPFEADPIHIFDDPLTMWQVFIRNYGLKIISQWVGDRMIPESPSNN